jgi:hypothetical protein
VVVDAFGHVQQPHHQNDDGWSSTEGFNIGDWRRLPQYVFLIHFYICSTRLDDLESEGLVDHLFRHAKTTHVRIYEPFCLIILFFLILEAHHHYRINDNWMAPRQQASNHSSNRHDNDASTCNYHQHQHQQQ